MGKRGRPPTTHTGHRGPRVAVSPGTIVKLDALALPGESRPATLARVVNETLTRRIDDFCARLEKE